MIHLLPTINATLNAISAVLLVWGYTLIRRKQIEKHKRVMLTAFVTSCLFLVCYLVYHTLVGGSVPFGHEGTVLRTVYFSILITHTILAATVPVLAIITLRRGLAAKVRSSPTDREVDAADLAVRQRDGRGGVRDAVSPGLNSSEPVEDKLKDIEVAQLARQGDLGVLIV